MHVAAVYNHQIFNMCFHLYTIDLLIYLSQVSATNGIRMINLRQQIGNQLNQVPPLDGIILLCDSDITDIVFDKISTEKAADLLAAYTADLLFVIQAAQSASVPIAITSPVGVLLEGPIGAPNSVRFHDKKEAIVTYLGKLALFITFILLIMQPLNLTL